MRTPGLLGEALGSLADQAAAFESLLLIASALHKLLGWSHLQDVVRRFGGVPSALAPASLAAIAMGEVAAGGLLWVPALRTRGAVLAALIWTTYALLILRAIVQGRGDADCGCSFGRTQRPLGAYQIVRNGVLMCLAVAVALEGGHAVSGGMQGSQILAASALLALYGALDQVMGLQPLRGGEAR